MEMTLSFPIKWYNSRNVTLAHAIQIHNERIKLLIRITFHRSRINRSIPPTKREHLSEKLYHGSDSIVWHWLHETKKKSIFLKARVTLELNYYTSRSIYSRMWLDSRWMKWLLPRNGTTTSFNLIGKVNFNFGIAIDCTHYAFENFQSLTIRNTHTCFFNCCTIILF